MTRPGDLIQADDYAFAFRRLEPGPDPPRALLVLLHGVDGDEMQLAGLGARAPSGTLVVLPRGHRSISGERWGWYRVGFAEEGPQVVEEEMHEARTRLGEFVRQLQAHHDVPPSRTWLGGFSQGGILVAAVALTQPAGVAGFVMMSGRLLAEIEPLIVPSQQLHHLQALVVHGRGDSVLPVGEATNAAARLQALDVPHTLHLHDGGHGTNPAVEDDVAAWLAGVIGDAGH